MKLFLLVLLLFFLGCEEKYTNVAIDQNISIDKNITNVENLKLRYQEYWEVFSKGEYDKSYAYELPYLNYIKSLQWYKDFNRIRKNDYKVSMLNIKSYPYDAKVALVRTRFQSPHKTFELSDRWVQVGDTWYHYYKQSLLPKPPRPIIKY